MTCAPSRISPTIIRKVSATLFTGEKNASGETMSSACRRRNFCWECAPVTSSREAPAAIQPSAAALWLLPLFDSLQKFVVSSTAVEANEANPQRQSDRCLAAFAPAVLLTWSVAAGKASVGLRIRFSRFAKPVMSRSQWVMMGLSREPIG